MTMEPSGKVFSSRPPARRTSLQLFEQPGPQTQLRNFMFAFRSHLQALSFPNHKNILTDQRF